MNVTESFIVNGSCVFAAATHVFEGVMRHRQGSSLLQVVIPVEVRSILSRVSICGKHISPFKYFFLQQNVSYHSFHIKQTYRTPPTPDSCWCPLKAKEFWGKTQEDYLLEGTSAGQRVSLEIVTIKSAARPHQQEYQQSWKLKIYELKALKWHPYITFTIPWWSSWLQ